MRLRAQIPAPTPTSMTYAILEPAMHAEEHSDEEYEEHSDEEHAEEHSDEEHAEEHSDEEHAEEHSDEEHAETDADEDGDDRFGKWDDDDAGNRVFMRYGFELALSLMDDDAGKLPACHHKTMVIASAPGKNKDGYDILGFLMRMAPNYTNVTACVDWQNSSCAARKMNASITDEQAPSFDEFSDALVTHIQASQWWDTYRGLVLQAVRTAMKEKPRLVNEVYVACIRGGPVTQVEQKLMPDLLTDYWHNDRKKEKDQGAVQTGSRIFMVVFDTCADLMKWVTTHGIKCEFCHELDH